MNWKTFFFCGSVVVMGGLSTRVAADQGEGVELQFARDIRPLLIQYCFDCHDADSQKGGVDFEVFGESASFFEERRLWETVIMVLRDKDMPPRRQDQPTEEERQRLISFVQVELAKLDCDEINPGLVTLRRLNRSEYNNTIRDLLGLDFKPAADFPSDEVGYGFDNIGDVLSLPPILLEKYMDAAEEIASRAIGGQSERGRNRIISCSHTNHTLECAGKILGDIARRAYRRPVSEADVKRLAQFVELARENGGTFEEGIQLALQAILVSPQFLFRWELDSLGHSEENGGIRELNDHELASRLSYFIWSSMPDDELFSLADQGLLRQPEVLEAQAQRMLKDPKALALVENFAGQWLQIRNLELASPDPVLYPEFDDQLRSAMRKETELFFAAIMREGRSIMEFLDADFTYLNERLARHYGIPGIEGEEFQRVSIDYDSPRGGILTQASILTITSNPTRTSPVNRGKWILEQILGTPPPPPPPDVEELEENEEALEAGSLRQRLELHRAKAECATCHNRMDPLGFAFENFNAIGAWRDYDGRFPVDASGVLPSGQAFEGAQELKTILKQQDTFIRTVTEKMLTFALGRGLEYYDRCTVDQIGEALAENEYRFPVLVAEIVKSEPFTKKTVRGE